MGVYRDVKSAKWSKEPSSLLVKYTVCQIDPFSQMFAVLTVRYVLKGF